MFPEWRELKKIESSLGPGVRRTTLDTLNHGNSEFPLTGYSFGTDAPDAPVLGIIGGIHGLERVGTWVALAFLRYLAARMTWDEGLKWQLERMRVFILPLANPIGMARFNRSNGNGVDLMRNSPVESDDSTFLVGGHRISPKLPWYRGNPSRTFEGMEAEAKAVIRLTESEIAKSPVSIILDLHSGFGTQDQIWFPYARTRAPFPELSELWSFKELLDDTLPHHVYKFEPQSKNYRTHGDLWDYVYDRHQSGANQNNLLLPLTLEMGSWNWVKKNPIQLFSSSGPFNPVKPHRLKRTMRRHLPFFDFLMRALISSPSWRAGEARTRLHQSAMNAWFSE